MTPPTAQTFQIPMSEIADRPQLCLRFSTRVAHASPPPSRPESASFPPSAISVPASAMTLSSPLRARASWMLFVSFSISASFGTTGELDAGVQRDQTDSGSNPGESMCSVSLLQAKATLSRLVEAIEPGKERAIVIARNGRPVARLVSVDRQQAGPRLGVAKGLFEVPEDIDAHNAELAQHFSGAGPSTYSSTRVWCATATPSFAAVHRQ